MRSLKIYLIIAGLLLIGYTILQFNQPKPTDWTATYIDRHKKPFGTYITYNRLHDIFPGSHVSTHRETPFEVLTRTKYQRSAYVIVTGSIAPTNEDYNAMMAYVRRGNDIFIAAESFGTVFQDSLNITAASIFGMADPSEYISFVNPELDNERQYHIDKGTISNYFKNIDSTRAVLLGQNNKGEANFIKYKAGKGNLYLLANPKLLSNYSLLKTQGAQYSATTLSYLGKPQIILWDEFYTQGMAGTDSPMRFILNNDALRTAWYIALFGLLFYVIYGVKRRQRAIPVILPPANATVEFVTTVGQVYYERRNNLDIAHKKSIYFLTSLREKYNIKTNKLDPEFVEALTKRSGVDAAYIRMMTDFIGFIFNQTDVSDAELIELNRLIEKFYTLSGH
ncbi:DUF4350 domain-containing protein [Mucilaginibacter sp. UR6-1]|uniref:DUF4350 domain-containing protein n=1 Tax=Mucilaginibacter sp. UR6-1 TaxID=1435643 RepID=UPI001E62C030|nr:DUF4350 domain-containing protein [Mucilaginibacter sp. UR6-1]MCC8408433.1 DUF4350 domain-containing protein [Mucilaginibacter sp. UR6-1]